MNKREKIIAIITALVFVFWLRNMMSGGAKKRPSSVRKAPRAASPARPAPKKISQQSIEAKKIPVPDFDWQAIVQSADFNIESRDAPLDRDPFEKLDYRSVFTSTALEFSELSLSGIIWEESAPMALINNQILAAGEIISGFKVEEIRKNEVILIKGTEKFIMRLYSQQFSE